MSSKRGHGLFKGCLLINRLMVCAFKCLKAKSLLKIFVMNQADIDKGENLPIELLCSGRRPQFPSKVGIVNHFDGVIATKFNR